MCTGHCAHILEVMFFVDVDGTLSDFMRTILVYLFCDIDRRVGEEDRGSLRVRKDITSR